jgi:hypothetical protein
MCGWLKIHFIIGHDISLFVTNTIVFIPILVGNQV